MTESPNTSPPEQPGGPLRAEILHGLAQVNLRGKTTDRRFMAAARKCLGQPLPVTPNSSAAGQPGIHWLGPDEWLVTASDDRELAARLASAVAGMHAAVNDVSSGQLAIRLSGRHARDLFARGCTLDFHPRAFPPGTCAQSGLARASVLIAHLGEAGTYELFVRRSFSDYLLQWLRHAGAGFGLRISAG